ncbi:hypothetical protein SeGA_4379, partial [Salmonella enterica subsp. enterica serovar Gaminara str. A4-567]
VVLKGINIILHRQPKYLGAGVTIGADSAHGCPSRQ